MNALDPNVAEFRERLKQQRSEKRCPTRGGERRPDISPRISKIVVKPLPAVAAHQFVPFRGAARNGFRARQSGATIPAYRDTQLEAHRIQDTQKVLKFGCL